MGISRRSFLRLGIATATLAAGGGPWPLLGCAREGDGGSGSHDVCVVGSGFAGIFLGLRLAERGVRTVILEAGEDPGPGGAPRPGGREHASTTSGEVRYPVDAARRIRPGGTSAVWAGVLTRLWPADFRVRSLFGMDADWPIAYEELEPWYCQAEAALGAVGLPVVEGAEPERSCGYPHRAGRGGVPPRVALAGRELRWFSPAASSRDGKPRPLRLAEVELPRFRSLPHGTLLTGRRVARVVSLDGRTVDHVEAVGPGGAREKVRARRFVLAAGVVENARLLLLSTSRHFPRGIGNGRDLVGRHFTAHPTANVVLELDAHHAAARGTHRTHHFSEALRRERLGSAHFQLRAAARARSLWQAQWEIEPRAENRVTLAPDRRDALGNPLPELRFSWSERDRRTEGRSREILAALAKGSAAGEPGSASMRWRFHPAGVCRMAAGASGGVVDADCRVFGLDNLYVSGACVFPTAGTANPTLTVVALTLRLAEHLAAKARRP